MLKMGTNVSCKSLSKCCSISICDLASDWVCEHVLDVLYASEAACSSIYNHCLQNNTLQECGLFYSQTLEANEKTISQMIIIWFLIQTNGKAWVAKAQLIWIEAKPSVDIMISVKSGRPVNKWATRVDQCVVLFEPLYSIQGNSKIASAAKI